MIESSTIALDYIKKEDYLGSYRGMRFRLGKVSRKEKTAKDESGEAEEEILKNYIQVAIWPEPFNFIKTDEEKKQYALFPLSKEGKEEAVLWLNQQYEEQKSIWSVTVHV